ncbi:hypothetical protein KJ865_13815, partial [Myxococcota bacterium]|nr:hypothetical protein [Myxococcota bacterium]
DFIDKHIVFQLHKKNVRQPGYLSSRMIEYLPEHIEELKLITPWPFIDLSGSLHTQKGFYTGTLLTEDFGFVEYVDALEDLDKHLLSLIPFNSQVSKVRFLSILLSAILRPFFKGPIPAFVILGDRKYSQLISQILLGSKSILLSRGSQFAEELRKGKSVFLFNTAKRYADSLGESITQSRVIVPTGHGQKLQFQNQTLNIISSKNNTLDGFSEGYYLPIGIENSSSELPSENNRMEIISCCVSLVKQWMDQRGPIYRVKNISAFPEWSQIIGSVLRTIGLNAHLNVHAPDVSLNEKALTISSALKREKVEAFTAEQLLELLTLEEQDNLGINKSRQLPSLLKKCFGGRLIPTKLSHKQKNEYRLLNPQSFIDSDEPIGFMMDRGK